MSWLFSRALVEASLGENFSAGQQCAPLSVMPTPHRFWRRGKMIEYCHLSLFGLTCAVLTEDRGEDVLTWCLAGSRARTLALRGKALASKANGQDCGRKCHASLARYNPVTHSWKTAQHSLLEDSMLFSGTWPKWGLMRAGECFELPTLASRTGATESGSRLPTPSGVNGGKNHTMGRVDEWGGSSNPLRGTVIGSMCLPEFEEMVMGWPIGWTALTPYAMDRFQEWLSEHGENFPRAMRAAA